MTTNRIEKESVGLTLTGVLRVKTLEESLLSPTITRRRVERDEYHEQEDEEGDGDRRNGLEEEELEQGHQQQHASKGNIMKNSELSPPREPLAGQNATGIDSRTGNNTTSSTIVRFDKVKIREYTMTIGDNPCCSSGAPSSLDWRYNPNQEETTVDSFENSRAGNRRLKTQMIIPASVRHDMLRNEWEVSTKEILKATEEVVAIQNERNKSVKQIERRARLKALVGEVKLILQKCTCCAFHK